MNNNLAHWLEKDRIDSLAHAVNTDNPEYQIRLEEARIAKKCPFCELEELRVKTWWFILDESKWVWINNSWPYKGSEQHLVFFPQAHKLDYRELLKDDIFTLQNFVRTSVDKYTIPGWFVTMRFGHPYYSGVTLNHLHSHLIQPRIINEEVIESSPLYTLSTEQLCRSTRDRVLAVENGWQVSDSSLWWDEPTKHLIFESSTPVNKEFIELESLDLASLHTFICNYLATCNFLGGWLAIWFGDPDYSWVPSGNLRIHIIQPQVEIGDTTFRVKPVNVPIWTRNKTNVVTFSMG